MTPEEEETLSQMRAAILAAFDVTDAELAALEESPVGQALRQAEQEMEDHRRRLVAYMGEWQDVLNAELEAFLEKHDRPPDDEETTLIFERVGLVVRPVS